MTARKCPTCAGSAELALTAVLPFCSPTCKLVDLGRWLDGSYRIPGDPLEIENDGSSRENNDGDERHSPPEAEDG